MELREGAVIAGKLRLVRPLGQGGMGVVWVARHLALDTDVAVKLIKPERGESDASLLTRFEREAQTTARIAHPNVVRIMDYGALDGAYPYIVMELLQGYSLAELLEGGGRLSLETARMLVRQIASALGAAHERGVVHRDIKPQNVFITEGTREVPLAIKVLDFGIAKVASGESDVPFTNQTLTQTGSILGSPPYMSPEQLEGSRNLDARTDLWSLAIVTYEALTGARPFAGSSLVGMGAAVLAGRYRPASELRPNLPRRIDDWFAKALSVDRDARFQSAAAMADAFEDALALDVAIDVEANGLATGRDTASGHVETAAHVLPARRARGRGVVRAAVAVGFLMIATASALSPRVRAIAAGQSPCAPGMARIAGATFDMGSDPDGEIPSDETPRHRVKVEGFCLDTVEVTHEAFAKCETCREVKVDVDIEGLTPNGRSFWSEYCNRGESTEDGQRPANCIDWRTANMYCASIGKRLPTEAEWELAARGTERRTFPWGEEPPTAERVNACGVECERVLTAKLERMNKPGWPRLHDTEDGAPSLARGGRYRAGATPTGVLDLAGNVWEWTDSRYCPYGNDTCEDSRRVLRGGGWDTVESQYLRAAHRRPSAPTARGWSIGFRCAK